MEILLSLEMSCERERDTEREKEYIERGGNEEGERRGGGYIIHCSLISFFFSLQKSTG